MIVSQLNCQQYPYKRNTGFVMLDFNFASNLKYPTVGLVQLESEQS
ncbi:unnamed protein product [Paramecium octaurelia]|uniref:Uncharacterized protein n=1 Tax=Paramecium octaurelia TaxID=43137 RepID=A0A8S1TPJ0_PAROT|nr:unnamed protein product [Paramecium octaurelia]